MIRRFFLNAAFLLVIRVPHFSAGSAAQTARGPEPAPLPAPITTPRDRPFPGRINLSVDITDVQRRIVNVHETIPVSSGDITLLYPKWIPGNHSPTGPI